MAKVNLEDILHAIDIEESPIVQAEDIEGDGRKLKKGKSVKKLDFAGEDVGFIFQPRKLMTRFSKKAMKRKMIKKVSDAMHLVNIIYLSPSSLKEVVIM